MALELVLLKDGRQLDVVRFGEGGPQFDTGAAQAVVGRLALMSGLSGPGLERLAEGWSNGYVTLRAVNGAAFGQDDDLVGIAACMPPTVAVPKPGPCPGRRGVPSVKPKKSGSAAGRKVGKKVAQPQAEEKAGPPVEPKAAQKAGKKVSARQLFAAPGQRQQTPVTDPAKLDLLKGVYETSHGGLSSRLAQVTASENRVMVNAVINGPDGAEVGEFEWEIRLDRRGGMFADLSLMVIEPQFQGQGFAKQSNNQAIDWYRNSGMDRAQLFANMDVGALAWALAGWDWASAFDAQALQDRLRAMAGGKDRKAAGLAQGMLDRFAGVSFGSPGYPTPLELAEMGRAPGQGKGDTWPGKVLFRSHPDPEHPDHLGWNAELPFKKPQVAVAAAAGRQDRREMVEQLVAAHDEWVGANLGGTQFVARPDSRDFNLYYVDVDASGSAQDSRAEMMGEVLALGRAGGAAA